MRTASILRLAHRVLPLEKRYRFLTRGLGGGDGMLRVPWGAHHFDFPAQWIESYGQTIYKEPRVENPEYFDLLDSRVRGLRAGTIVDVGANAGIYTLNFRGASDLPIVAYEPAPAMCALLRHNVLQNRLAGVEVRNSACGDRRGTIELSTCANSFISPSPGSNGAEGQAGQSATAIVPLVTLDEDLKGQGAVGLIKIDCEGFEYHVIAGALGLLKRWKPILFVELHPHLITRYGHSIEDVYSLLDADYDCESWDLGRRQRSPSKLARFVSRYGHERERLGDLAAVVQRAAAIPVPLQLFLVATPRNR